MALYSSTVSCYFSSDTATADERREGIAQTLQLDLLPYLAGTPLASQVEILHDPGAGDRWGAGVGGSVVASTFVNQNRTMRLAPALEYSVFPYAESTRRQLTFTYAVGANALDYEELTIFGKTSEFLTDETLIISLDVTQPWGRSSLSVDASHFFADLGKYRSVVFGDLECRVFRGLSLEVFGSTSLIRDQVFLPARGSSVEEVLVRRRQLATNYQHSLFLGISYTFGSIFNNVVNSRFAGSSGGVIRRF